MNRVMGIISDINFGCRDRNFPMIWFTVRTLRGSSLQIIGGEDILSFVKDNRIVNINDLEGKPCVVETDDQIMKFRELCKW